MSWKTLKHPSSRRIKKSFFVLRSSFFQDQAPTALEELPPIQDQAPTALEESTIVHHPFIQDQAPTALWINKRRQIHTSNRSSRSSPKALEDPSAQIHLQRSSPRPFEETSNSSSKIKPRRPLDQSHIHQSTPYGYRIRGSNLREIEFSVFTNWHAQWDNLYLSSLPPFKEYKHTSKINDVKEGSSCSHNRRKEQRRPRRKWCHVGCHDLKQSKSYLCHLFHLCINSARGTSVHWA
ncbi:hypothetical protein ACFX2H_012916 [Malus domestica]